MGHESLSSKLGLRGPITIRPYGTAKHAHLVLRKVDEESFEDALGRKITRAVFSIFAHKPMNVKAGKELFLYLHPVNGALAEQCIAIQGLLSGPEVEDSDIQAAAQPITEEPSLSSSPVLSSYEHVVPPKMRKQWARSPEITKVNSEFKGKLCAISTLLMLYLYMDSCLSPICCYAFKSDRRRSN